MFVVNIILFNMINIYLAKHRGTFSEPPELFCN